MSEAQAAQPPPARAREQWHGREGQPAGRTTAPGPPPSAPPPRAGAGHGQGGRARTDEAPPPPAPPRPDDHLRLTPAERQEAQERLRHAVVNETIDLDEYGRRLKLTLAATTRRELRRAVDDLAPAVDPTAAEAVHTVRRDLPKRSMVVAVLGGDEAKGRWRPAATTTAISVMGGSRIDLRLAEFDGDRLTINAFAFMGAVEVIVPDGVEVTLSGLAIMGGRDCKSAGPVDPGAPLVHVNGYALMGGVDVRPASRKERRRAERDGEVPDPATVPLRSPTFRTAARPVPTATTTRRRTEQRRVAEIRGRIGRAIAGVALAAVALLPVTWALSSDQTAVSVFGGSMEEVLTVDPGDVTTVGALVAFGGVDIVVPDDVIVERDGVVIFGGADVPTNMGIDAENPGRVVVRTFGGFGGVDVIRQSDLQSELDS